MEQSNRNRLSRLTDKQLEELRKTFISELKEYIRKSDKKKLIISKDRASFIDGLIFDYNVDENGKIYKTFALSKNALGLIDFRNISFLAFKASDQNFKRISGICLDPQLVYKKDLSNSQFGGVKFCGRFDDCIITNSDFSESKGAIIDPQTIKYKCFNGVNLKHVKIVGPFDDCSLRNVSFRGSVGAVVDPQKIRDKDLSNTKLADAEIIGTFEGCEIGGVSFARSKGAIVDPQVLNGKNLTKVNLQDARVVGSFEGCNIESTRFEGMIDEFSASNEFVNHCKKLIIDTISESN